MTNSTVKLLQQNIKKYRKQKNITQLRLSVMSGVSKDYITLIECGKRVPSIKTLILISEALKIEPYKFFIEE